MSRRPTSESPPLPLLYSVPRAARLIGFSERTVWRMVAAEEIPSVRIGGSKVYIPRLALEQWLSSLPGVSASQALDNCAKRGLIEGMRPERIDVTAEEDR